MLVRPRAPRPRRGAVRVGREATVVLAAAIVLSVCVVAGQSSAMVAGPAARLPTRPLAATLAVGTGTRPSGASAASLYLSNWKNIQAIWMAPTLDRAQTAVYGPRLAELHYSGNWSVNQINDYTGFYIDETDHVKYDRAQDFTTTGYLDRDGVLNGDYGTYNGLPIPIRMSRDFVLVPNEPFMVVRYRLTNPSTTKPYHWDVLDQVRLNNTDDRDNVSGTFSSTTDTLFANMTASSQYVVFLGALQAPSSYQVGNDADCTATGTTASAWCQFDAHGSLPDNRSLSTPDMDLGFQDEVTIAPGSTRALYYYMGIAPTLTAAQADAGTAGAQTGAYWYNTTASDYTRWLDEGKTISTADTGVNMAYLRNLIVIKDSQNPGTGLFPTSTNPTAYGYQSSVPGSCFDAMALDASGHYPEAQTYWEWMAAHRQAGGTWPSTFNLWTGSRGPSGGHEYASVGQFLVGVYEDYRLTGDTTFLSATWPAVKSAAGFIDGHVGRSGLGAEDRGPWGQVEEHSTYTAAFYIAGLRAAAHLALDEGSTSAADRWDSGAGALLSAVQRPYSSSPPGEWDGTTGYYDQGVTASGSPDTTIGSAGDELIALGDIDAASAQAASQILVIEEALGHGTYGVSRYPGDNYYSSGARSPAADETGPAEPEWPSMTMLVALYQIYTGNRAAALPRLQWYAGVSGAGYMPPGEAVSWQTNRSVLSSMSSLFTAATFVTTALSYSGQYDERIYPTGPDASAPASVVGTGAIVSLTTNASRYAPGSRVTVKAVVLNPQVVSDSETLALAFFHDGARVGPGASFTISLAAGEVATHVLNWRPPNADYRGYLVVATLSDDGPQVLDRAYTAVDVSSTWARFPRYGFVTDFADNYLQSFIADRLNLYHIDGVQFYDWEHKHQSPLAGTVAHPAVSWVNVDGNTNYRHSVETLIADLHRRSSTAMSYNAIYAAWAGYGQAGSGVDYKWGLWQAPGCTDQAAIPLPDPPLATPYLFLFDPANPGWQQYLFAQEKEADEVYPFDGWQEDQYGDSGPYYTCTGREVDLANEFNGYLTDAGPALGGDLVFNAVGQYGQQEVAQNPFLTFLYTECWPANGQVTYNDLREAIDDNDMWSNGAKATVLAAYPDQARADDYSATRPGFFGAPGVLYEDAAIFASGGDHIELGDVDHMLDAPNYLNEDLLMAAPLQRAMINYYNFLTAYEDLLRNGEVASSNVIDLPGGPPTSTNGAAGTVWTFARSTTDLDVLQFINLSDLYSPYWVDPGANQPPPIVHHDVEVKYYYSSGAPPRSVDIASPDIDGGMAKALPFTIGTDGHGRYLVFQLPSLDYWDMAWVNY